MVQEEPKVNRGGAKGVGSAFKISAEIGGIAAAVIALVSLAVTAGGIRSDLRNQHIADWQEVTAFSAIRESGLDGISFDDLQRKFNSKEHELPEALPREATQTDALYKVLISLIAKRAISTRQNGNFGIALDAMTPEEMRVQAVVIRMEEVANALMTIVAESPGRYSYDELYRMLSDKFKFSEQEWNHLRFQMEAAGAVYADDHGKVKHRAAASFGQHP